MFVCDVCVLLMYIVCVCCVFLSDVVMLIMCEMDGCDVM